MARVFGFDEASFRRVREATRRVLGTPRTGAQQRRQPPVLGVGGGGGGTGIVDGCKCDNDSLVQGVPLGGSPTVCCTSHEQFTVDLGDLGTFNLWHADAAGVMGMSDTWSTFHEDSALDNPLVIDCSEYSESPLEDEYDVVVEVAATPPTLTLVSRNSGYENCEVICLEYVLDGEFECQGRNQFVRKDWSGFTSAIGTPTKCVCVVPSDQSSNETSECACFEEAQDRPKFAIVTISEVTIGPLWDVECSSCGCNPCEGAPGTFCCPHPEMINGLYAVPLHLSSPCFYSLCFPANDTIPCERTLQVSLTSVNGDIEIFAQWALIKDNFDEECDVTQTRASFGAGYDLVLSPAPEGCILDEVYTLVFDPSSTSDNTDCIDHGMNISVTFSDTPPKPTSSGRCTPCGS